MACLYVKRQGRDIEGFLLLSAGHSSLVPSQTEVETACLLPIFLLTALFFLVGYDCLRKGFFYVCEDCSAEENRITSRPLAGKVFASLTYWRLSNSRFEHVCNMYRLLGKTCSRSAVMTWIVSSHTTFRRVSLQVLRQVKKENLNYSLSCTKVLWDYT